MCAHQFDCVKWAPNEYQRFIWYISSSRYAHMKWIHSLYIFTYIVIKSFSVINKYIRIYSTCCYWYRLLLRVLYIHILLCATYVQRQVIFLYSFIGLLFIECFLLVSFCLHILQCIIQSHAKEIVAIVCDFL